MDDAMHTIFKYIEYFIIVNVDMAKFGFVAPETIAFCIILFVL
jgi:hypothetical protein